MDVYQVVMDNAKHIFSLDDARRWLRRAGYKESGANAVCSDLAQLGYLRRLGDGTYMLRLVKLDASWPAARARLNASRQRQAWKNLNHPADSGLRSMAGSTK